jgi:hypothetical protein
MEVYVNNNLYCRVNFNSNSYLIIPPKENEDEDEKMFKQK